MKATTAGYSGTPLPAKLGLKRGMRFLVLHPAANLDDLLRGAPELERLPRLAEFDFGLAFVESERAAIGAFERLAPKMTDAGMLWVAWPKKASGVATDLTEDIVRRAGLAAKLVDVKVCAIDATWSGLRFVRRLSDRKR